MLLAMNEVAWARALDELGLELPALPWSDFVNERVLRLIYAAVQGELGFAHEYMYGATAMVAVVDERIVIAVHDRASSKQPFPPAWGFTRWSKAAPAKNRPMVEDWVRTPPDGAIVGRVTRRAVARDDDTQLRAALMADPDDVATRSVYADWLIERGDVRGEIMQLRHAGRHAEASALLNVHHRAIVESVQPFTRGASAHTGLVERIEIGADQLARHAGALLARHPIHRLQVFATKAAQLAKLVPVTPLLARTRDLHLEGRIARNTLGGHTAIAPSVLAPTPLFANVRALRLTGIGDDLAEWDRFLSTLAAPHLVALVCDALPTAEVLAMVASPTTLPRLRALRFAKQPPVDDLEQLARSLASRAALSVLALWAWPAVAMPAIARILVEAPALVDLELSLCGLDDRTLRELVRGRFTRLALHGAFSVRALLDLLSSQPLRALSLRLQATPAETDLIVTALAAAPSSLAEITWWGKLDDDQAARIATTRTLIHQRY